MRDQEGQILQIRRGEVGAGSSPRAWPCGPVLSEGICLGLHLSNSELPAWEGGHCAVYVLGTSIRAHPLHIVTVCDTSPRPWSAGSGLTLPWAPSSA